MSLDTTKLQGHIPDSVLTEIPEVAEKFAINTPLRMAHFLAQVAHESGDFKIKRESLNYSKPERIAAVWPSRFNLDGSNGKLNAHDFVGNQEKLANTVYANRIGNGDAASGDGFKFRGAGYIQLTGKDNFAAFGKSIGEDVVANPSLVPDKYPLASAAWFWGKNGLNALADAGHNEEAVTKVTKKVNGGVVGLPERLANFNKYFALLTPEASPSSI